MQCGQASDRDLAEDRIRDGILGKVIGSKDHIEDETPRCLRTEHAEVARPCILCRHILWVTMDTKRVFSWCRFNVLIFSSVGTSRDCRHADADGPWVYS
jgi:hypothetical protein